MAKRMRGQSTAAIDDHIGGRIRERRIMLGLTQQQLAEMIGVTYQQAHKYERGINRVSAGRLFEVARALSAPITYFYEGIGEEGTRQIMPHQRMLLELARNFAEIRNEKHQEAVSRLPGRWRAGNAVRPASPQLRPSPASSRFSPRSRSALGGRRERSTRRLRRR